LLARHGCLLCPVRADLLLRLLGLFADSGCSPTRCPASS